MWKKKIRFSKNNNNNNNGITNHYNEYAIVSKVEYARTIKFLTTLITITAQMETLYVVIYFSVSVYVA